MSAAIKETVSYIRERIPERPDTAIILGTGLGKIVDFIEVEQVVDYESIPHFPVSTVEGHEGKLISGKL
jgi:purine-nucleoside phosphorylase